MVLCQISVPDKLSASDEINVGESSFGFMVCSKGGEEGCVLKTKMR